MVMVMMMVIHGACYNKFYSVTYIVVHANRLVEEINIDRLSSTQAAGVADE